MFVWLVYVRTHRHLDTCWSQKLPHHKCLCNHSVGIETWVKLLYPRRRHLNIRGKSANLPAITEKDWLDLQFGIDVGVDYYALSFVRSADVIYELKAYLAKQGK